MLHRRVLRAGVLGLLAAGILVAMSAGTAQGQSTATFNVTIENLTTGQPFTPPVVVAHSDQIDVFEVGEAASSELSQIAENGNNDPLVTLIGASDAVEDSTVGDAPILPGESATLSIQATPGSLLSLVSMLICTNDGFTGVDSMPLPASGSETVETNAYDAGSEQNTEDFANMVPPCQELVGVMSDDEGTGMSDPALAEGGVIAMHPGITGDADLTVADHGWTDPVARITVSVEEAADMADGLPTTGIAGTDEGGSTSLWPVYLGIGGAVLFVLGGGVWLARRRSA